MILKTRRGQHDTLQHNKNISSDKEKQWIWKMLIKFCFCYIPFFCKVALAHEKGVFPVCQWESSISQNQKLTQTKKSNMVCHSTTQGTGNGSDMTSFHWVIFIIALVPCTLTCNTKLDVR
jgi:hypothetical protein